MNFWAQFPEVNNKLNRVDDIIRASLKSHNNLLQNVSLELLNSGGKRLRPALTILSAEFGNYEEEKLLLAAGAIEVLHTATLVHDDIIDNSQLRRGRVTVNNQYGVDMAVYTGDFLFTKAIFMLSKAVSAERLDMIAQGIKSICEGEVDQYQSKFTTNVTVLSYLKRVNRKTAILFSASCALGANCGNCDDNTTKKLAKVGAYFGAAFQIKDDINDYMDSEETSGKPVLKDLKEGLITLPVIFALKKDDNLKELISNMFGNRQNISISDALEVSKLVRSCGGVEDAKKLMEKYLKRAEAILDSLPDINSKYILRELLLNINA